MKSPLLFTLACLITIFSNAQINFEQGYTINNSGQKVTCLIKNADWKNNPDKFQYKITTDSNFETGLLNNFSEFGFEDGTRFVGREVQINRSSNKTEKLEHSRDIEFQTEKLFLKVIVEGNANLYYYEDNDLRRFFYETNTNEIIQLRYKRYLKESSKNKTSGNQIGENNDFRQQLWNNLNCNAQNKKMITKLAYKIDPLIKLFNDHNLCMNPNYDIDEKTAKKISLNITLRPGVDMTSLKVDKSSSAFRDVDFDQKTSLRVGLEFEAILPFNKNKWSLLIEPTYHSYSDEGEIKRQQLYPYLADVKYTSLELPIGVRHYMFLNDKSKLFINGSVLFDIPFDSGVTYSNTRILTETKARFGFNPSFVMGMGFNFNNKLSIECRYLGRREVFASDEFFTYTSDYSGFSLILGYTIF